MLDLAVEFFLLSGLVRPIRLAFDLTKMESMKLGMVFYVTLREALDWSCLFVGDCLIDCDICGDIG